MTASLPKTTIIYDNRSCDHSLKHGFGFSCLIEWQGRKILFDTGGERAAFFDNIRQQNIQLNQITHAVFSHYHWNYTAAFGEVLAALRASTPLYLPDHFSQSLLKQVPPALQLHQVKSFQEIDANIYALVMEGKLFFGLWSLHELSLVLDTPKGLVVITGCAHPGIVNILKVVKEKFSDKKIHLVIGGFHLHHSFRCTSSRIVRQLQTFGVEKVAPCHCAGNTAISQFKAAYGSDFIEVGTGSAIQV